MLCGATHKTGAYSIIVWACFSVGKNAIIDAIRQKRPGTKEEHCLKAGTNCGSRIPEIKA